MRIGTQVPVVATPLEPTDSDATRWGESTRRLSRVASWLSMSTRLNVLGTVVEVRAQGRSRINSRAEERAFNEIERLQAVFNVFDETSDLRRYRTGAAPTEDLAEVLVLADDWRRRSECAFHPGVDRLRALWADSAEADDPPSADELAAAVEVLDTDTRSHTNLNALAKGWIVDRAIEAAFTTPRPPKVVWVNAGGDIRHRGTDPMTIGIEHPDRPYDNEPPLARVRLQDQALATSGSSRRGWQIGGSWYSHLLDPRTGRPVTDSGSASVIATDAASADVLATICTVDSALGLGLVEQTPGAACLLISADGNVTTSGGWPEDVS